MAFHALQSLFLQLFLWVLGWSLAIVAWIGSNAASQRLAFGFCLLPFAFLVNLLPIIGAGYAMIASMEIRRVGDFHYYRVSDWALAIIDRPVK